MVYKTILFVLWGAWAVACLADVSDEEAPAPLTRVCVRNYGDFAGNPCERFPKDYAIVPFAKSEERAKGACTRIYNEFYCEATKEYVRVRTIEDAKICVLNNDQPNVVNLCKSTPQFYNYVEVGN